MNKLAVVAFVTFVTFVAFVAFVAMGTAASAQADQLPTEVGKEILVINYQPEEELAAPLLIDELDPETVLTIRATGFDANTTGMIKQCLRGSSRRCRNQLPVRFDDRGAAFFQYLITDDFGSTTGEAEPCRLSGERCTIEVGAAGGLTVIDTVFVDQAPPLSRLDVTPRDGLLIGDTVTVTASQLPPGADLTVMICAAPATSGPRCGSPGPEVPLIIASDGTGQAEMTLDASEVGSDRVACGRRVTCRVVVTSDQQIVRAHAVDLSFDDSPGAHYTTPRLVVGLTVAVALALTAAWLVRSTNWNPPSESHSTPIDEADYADLDLEAALFDERSTTSASGVTSDV